MFGFLMVILVVSILALVGISMYYIYKYDASIFFISLIIIIIDFYLYLEYFSLCIGQVDPEIIDEIGNKNIFINITLISLLIIRFLHITIKKYIRIDNKEEKQNVILIILLILLLLISIIGVITTIIK